MLIIDRVTCDCCGQPMGQLYHQPAPQADRLTDQRKAPDYAICPDCIEAREVVRDPQLAE